MAKYSKKSPFFSKKIRILSGSSCLADIAIGSGCIWKPAELEKLLDLDLPRAGFTGIYRKMLYGVVPTDKTCNHIQSKELDTNIFYWRDLPLWTLLSDHLLGTEQYNQLLDEAWDPEDEKYIVPNNIFLNHSGYILNETTWHGISDHNFESIESLILYTARLIRAKEKDLLPLVCRYSAVTHYILEKIMYKTPQLYIRWPLLLKIYIDDLWPIKVPEFHLKFELGITLKLMGDLGKTKFASLYPPKHMHRRMNLQYLKDIYA